jgi:hypothetical protein
VSVIIRDEEMNPEIVGFPDSDCRIGSCDQGFGGDDVSENGTSADTTAFN